MAVAPDCPTVVLDEVADPAPWCPHRQLVSGHVTWIPEAKGGAGPSDPSGLLEVSC